MKNKKQMIGIIIVLLLVIRFCYVAYQYKEMPHKTVAGRASKIQVSTQMAIGSLETSMPLALEENEKTLLKTLYADYIAGDMNTLAEDFIDAYEDLEILLAKFGDKKYIYDGTDISFLGEGQEIQTGMVFLSPSKVFLGEFKAGYPFGETLAISAFEADVRRYDYARGDFSKGMLNGNAETGSVNLDLPESNIGAIKKSGQFVDDLMMGDIIYSLILEDGTEVSWNIKTENGITVTDDRWAYDEATDTYKLSDNMEGIHQYEMKKDMMSEVRWRNLLTWEK